MEGLKIYSLNFFPINASPNFAPLLAECSRFVGEQDD
jgi:hypothetical protein